MTRFPTAVIFLIAAWFCTNLPQIGLSALGEWLESGVRFSHQDDLARGVRAKLIEVAALQQQLETDSEMLAHSNEKVPIKPRAITATAMVKFEFAMWRAVEIVPPEPARLLREIDTRAGARRPRDVPIPVPRGVA